MSRVEGARRKSAGCLLRGLMINLPERAYYFARRIYASTVEPRLEELPRGRDKVTRDAR